MKRIEGFVEIEFTVTREGRVKNAKVIDSRPPQVFERAALRGIRLWRFKPELKDGNPVAVRALQRIDFSPGAAVTRLPLSMPWTRWSMVVLLWAMAAVTLADESALTPATYERLMEIRSLMERDLHQQAADQLKALVARTGNRPYDLAIVQQHLGHAYMALQDYPAACSAVEASLQTQALPNQVAHNQRYFLAQLYLHAEDHVRALHLMEKWLQARSESGTPGARCGSPDLLRSGEKLKGA